MTGTYEEKYRRLYDPLGEIITNRGEREMLCRKMIQRWSGYLDLLDLLAEAVERVEIANHDKILSAWLPRARKALNLEGE